MCSIIFVDFLYKPYSFCIIARQKRYGLSRTINSFKNAFDNFRSNQELKYYWRSEITGIGYKILEVKKIVSTKIGICLIADGHKYIGKSLRPLSTLN